PNVVAEFNDFHQQILDGLVMERVMATLCGFFGLLAASLVAIGIYGVISYIVALRRNEIGIRIALGAARGQVISLVLGQTGLPLAVGIALGTILALAIAHGAAALLYGLGPNDLGTFALASGLLAAVVILAAFVPARRASRLQPLEVLRYE